MQRFFYTLWNRLQRISVLDTDTPGIRRQKVTLVRIAICWYRMWHFTGCDSRTLRSKLYEERIEGESGIGAFYML